ncbi:MAG: TfoX/Sxy family protein [Actinomycetota bacterium]|nr:TfoX/Sxy family protein [Actinomycetota bacterium]
MAYDEELAARVRELLEERGVPSERKMFGGIAFMVNGHMCCGVIKEDLVLRLGPDAANKALRDPDVRPMDFTGRPMKGFVFVSAEGTKTEARLRRHVQSALDFVETLPPK